MMRKAHNVVCMIASIGLLALAGCSTAHMTRGQSWIDLFTPSADQSVTIDCANYGTDRLEKDYLTLMRLSRELDYLANEMAR